MISGLRTGGAETMLVALCRALQSRGIPQHVVSLTKDGANLAVLQAAGIEVHVIAPEGIVGAAASVMRLVRLIRRLRPVVLQGWLYHGDLFAALGHRMAGMPRGTLLAWGLRNSDIDHERYGSLLLLGRWLSGWPGLVISNSQAGADFHRSRGYRPRRLAVIPNGIDTERFRPEPALRASVRMEFGLAEETVVAVHVARLDPMKDHATLLAVAEQVPRIRFLLVGAGTETLTLPPNATALGRRDDLERIYAAGDIVVSTSAFGEGFSNALAEGMAAGLIPVATRVGDSSLILDDVGTLVPPGDAEGIAGALADLAALPAPDRRSIGIAARRRVVSTFGSTIMPDRFLAAWTGAGADLGRSRDPHGKKNDLSSSD
ncbi:glycosyltransferase [uncultured Methylobacterium sp.]|uniref:glycosyltransferase n=1 Tax=uncultured Methylobacterium sp. TaxID=157278 RepID=UPI0035CB262A